MSRRTTEALALELVDDLEPVRRIPRLHTVAALAVGVWAAGFAAAWALGGPAPAAGALGPLRVLVFLGGGLAAGGGLASALGSAVPGCGHWVRRGGALLGGGAALSVLAAGLAWVRSAGVSPEALPSPPALPCVVRATALALLPGLVALGFAARAYAMRPALTAALGTLGALSLGALAVHASCAASGARHVLLGHALGPLGVALVLAGPAALALSRRLGEPPRRRTRADAEPR